MDGSNPNSSSQSGEYVVVARRYRPQGFGDLIGQGMVAQALKNAITTDRVGHAYLFTGARGVGKTSTARILAKALNCEKGPTTEPCGQCDICLQISSGDDVDVLEIDGASNRGIDEIRQLRSNVGIRPSRSRFKIYIIDEVHMLTKEAFNALLKTLEEPPEHVKFIFCTTEPSKIPITVLSRCQRFDFSPVDTADIVRRLTHIVECEGATAEPEALELLARRAAGSMRDSQSLLEQLLSFVGSHITANDVHSMFGTAKAERVTALLRRLIGRDAAGTLAELEATLREGVDAGQLAEQLVTCLRDVMAIAVGADPSLLLIHSPADVQTLRKLGEEWGLQTLIAALQILDQSITRMRQSMHGRILLEVALIRIACLEDLDQLSQVVSRIASSEPFSATPKKKRIDRIDSGETNVAQRHDRNQRHDQNTSSAELSAPAAADTRQVHRGQQEQASVAVEATDEILRPIAPSLDDSINDAERGVRASADPNSAPKNSDCSSAVATTQSAVETESSTRTPAQPVRDVATELADRDQPSVPVTETSSQGESKPVQEIEEAVAITPPETSDRRTESDLTDDFTIEQAKQAWQQALTELADMTAEFASEASVIAISAPNRLVVEFPGRYNTNKSYCERPEKRLALEQMLEKVAGMPMKIEFRIGRDDRAEVKKTMPATASARQSEREIASHPLVELAVEMFDAHIVKVEPGQKEKN